MKRKIPFSFIIGVVLPVLVAAVYYGFYASKQYVVETKYIIQGHQKTQSDMFGSLAGLTGVSPSSKDSYIAQQYIWSAQLLNKLDKKIKIKEHYSDVQYDWWARLPKDAPFSVYLDYWFDVVDIEYDSISGITSLSVTAFTSNQALDIAYMLLEEAEMHVNKLTERSRSDSLSFAKKELSDAEKKLIQARTAITSFRNTQKDIDPEKTTAAKLELVTSLEGKLAEAQAELSSLSAFMKPDAFKVRSLKQKVSILKKQIQSERKRWGNTDNDKYTLSTRVADFEKLLAKKEVAEKLYESALNSLEASRFNAIQQQQYLEVITAPYEPSKAEKPYVFVNMISVMLGSFLLWAIGSLIVSAIKDHA